MGLRDRIERSSGPYQGPVLPLNEQSKNYKMGFRERFELSITSFGGWGLFRLDDRNELGDPRGFQPRSVV